MGVRLGSHPVLDYLLTLVSVIGDGKLNFVWASFFSLIFVMRRRTREARILFFGYCLGSLLSPLLKNVFSTVRPGMPDQLRSYSFPSGHTLTTTILVGILFELARREYPKQVWIYATLGMGWIIAVAFSRLYLRAHWPIDVIGG